MKISNIVTFFILYGLNAIHRLYFRSLSILCVILPKFYYHNSPQNRIFQTGSYYCKLALSLNIIEKLVILQV